MFIIALLYIRGRHKFPSLESQTKKAITMTTIISDNQ